MKVFLFFILIFAAVCPALAQEPGREQAIALFKQGETDRALPLLEKVSNGADAEILNYIGLAYVSKRDYKKGSKSLEKAVSLEPGNVTYRSNLAYTYLLNKDLKKARKEAEKILAADPNRAAGYFIRGRANLADGKIGAARTDAFKALEIEPLYAQAHTLKADAIFQNFVAAVRKNGNWRDEAQTLIPADETLLMCLEKCVKNPDRQIQEMRREWIGSFLEAAKEPIIDPEVPNENSGPGNSNVKIISKPRASYTDKARQESISGSVTLLLLFAANGEIPLIITLKGLGGGLTEESVKAARQIKFEPRMRNGKPVAAVLTIQYGFTIN